MNIEEYLTTREAACILDVTCSRVRQLLRSSDLKGYRLPAGLWLIKRQDVEDFKIDRRKAGRPRKEEDASTVA
ncbi:MAG: hypothetical protein CMA83_01335 [Euryarchaeota archaeon]|nr:hypothetical protein [Euryarchaeota archaeon]